MIRYTKYDNAWKDEKWALPIMGNSISIIRVSLPTPTGNDIEDNYLLTPVFDFKLL